MDSIALPDLMDKLPVNTVITKKLKQDILVWTVMTHKTIVIDTDVALAVKITLARLEER